MPLGVNKVILIGHAGRDPENQSTAGGKSVCKLSIATGEAYLAKDGSRKERTEWHNVIAFGRLAEILHEYGRKGSLLYIEGSLRTEKWQGKDGTTRYATKIVASTVRFLDKAPAATGEENFPDNGRQGEELPF